MKRKLAAGILAVLVITVAIWWQPPSSRLPVHNDKTATFFLLGMLDEYLGRLFYEEYPDRVEYFRSKRKAKVFTGLLSEHAKLSGTDQAFELRKSRQGGLEVVSQGYAKMLNSYYSFESGEPNWTGAYPGERTASASLKLSAFQGADRSTELAFLAGAYCRYGSDHRYRFANSNGRVNLIVELLERVGCKNVRLETIEAIPYMNTIEFEPTAELDEWLQRYSKCQEPLLIVLEAVMKQIHN